MSTVAKRIIIALVALIVVAAALLGVAVVRWGPDFGIWLTEPSPQRYGEVALGHLDQGINASSEAWQDERPRVEQAISEATSIDEVDAVLSDAVKIAGTKHSFLMMPDEAQEAVDEYEAPSVEENDGVVTVHMPAFMGTPDQGSEYAQTIAQAVSGANVCAAVIDLSENGGGDMGPMIAGISPLIPDGPVSYFVTGGGESAVMLESGKVSGGGRPTTVDITEKSEVPVAIVTGEHTASSGEQALLAFKGVPNTRVFGQPTAGYATVNTPFPLYGGKQLVVTVGVTKDRMGTTHAEDPIAPDVTVEPAQAVNAATQWARDQGCQ